MIKVVIDVNVPMVANKQSPQADEQCIKKCVKALEEVYKNGKVFLDNGGRILKEYKNRLRLKGQPGLGDAFMKWIWERQATHRCELVKLTLRNDNEDDFNEFPQDIELKNFDKADRKYVAVAIASNQQPIVLNAVDSDWWDYKNVLEKHGVNIDFLCPQCIEKNKSK